jgi:hypothetical protein
VATSSSTDHAKTDFQPGGTLTAVTGKWTGRCFDTVKDKSGLGRWSGHSLQTSTTAVHILSAYRPVQGSNDAANHTFYQQHWNILRDKGNPNPDPPKQFYIDLGREVTNWHQQGDSDIIMLDANEAITDNKRLLQFIASHNLASLITPIKQAPAT